MIKVRTAPQGLRGEQGAPGPIQASVANPTALAALSTAGFLPGGQAYVQNLKRSYYLDPTSVATPDNVTVIAAQGGGNWIALPGVGVLGSTTVGLAKFDEDGNDWGGIAAGATQTVYTAPGSGLATGEQITIACAVDIQSNAPIQVVTGVTATTPIAVSVPSTAAYQPGSSVYIAGVTGVAAANGIAYVGIPSPGTLTLYSDPGLTTPIAGTGAYIAGGTVAPQDFGHIERRATFRQQRGTISVVNSQGGTTDTDLTSPAPPQNAGASLLGTTAAIVVIAGIPQVQVTAPANTPILAAATVSFVRRGQAGIGPVPTITNFSVSSGTTTGGTAGVAEGAHFTGTIAVWIQVGATAYPASFEFVNDGTLNVTTGVGPAFGGVGTLVVETANGPGQLVDAFTYITDSLTIMGGVAAGAHVWLAKNAAQTAGVVTSLVDENTTAPRPLAPTASPTYTASSSTFTPAQPTVSVDGVSQFFSSGSVIGVEASHFAWIVCKWVGGVTAISYGGHSYWAVQGLPAFINAVLRPTGSLATFPEPSGLWVFYEDASAGSGGVSEISANNGTPVSSTGTGITLGGSLTFGVGVDPGTGLYAELEIVEIGFVPFTPGTRPTAPQLAALHANWQALYGTP